MEYAVLANGVKMPMLGYGVFKIPAENTKQCVLAALECGYRSIDTAAAYYNEKEVGEAIRESGIPREELFITTKLWVQDYGYENARRGFMTSLEKLGLDYVDLYLLHQPCSDYYGAYRALEDLYEEGKIRAIGVCNFFPSQTMDICLNMKIPPMVNQLECHPFRAHLEDKPLYDELGVVMEAWGPLAQGKKNVFVNETLVHIAEKYNKTTAQVMLRYGIQRGMPVIPKTVHKNRMKENLEVFDFVLSDEDMAAVSSLDEGRNELTGARDPETVRFLNQYKIHE